MDEDQSATGLIWAFKLSRLLAEAVAKIFWE